MRIAVLGTGMVGQAIGGKLVQLGHEVMMGSRSKDNQKAVDWVNKAGGKASQGNYKDAASFGEMIFNCTAGVASTDALRQAGKENLNGKILVDVSNPLDFSEGMPPKFTICNDDSLGEQIQKEFPETKVVKTLNTMNLNVMINPGQLSGDHDLLMCGNDSGAKHTVAEFLKTQFGWKSIIDLGDITQARGTEMYVALWIRLFGKLQTPLFNIKIVR